LVIGSLVISLLVLYGGEIIKINLKTPTNTTLFQATVLGGSIICIASLKWGIASFFAMTLGDKKRCKIPTFTTLFKIGKRDMFPHVVRKMADKQLINQVQRPENVA
jgi:hypothetical protein